MFERFTRHAREVVTSAVAESKRGGNHPIGTEHLLLALTDPEIGGVAFTVLSGAGIDRSVVLAGIARHSTSGSRPLSEEDAAALRTIGIDLDEVLARVEESFGPGALDTAPESSTHSARGGLRGPGRFNPAARKSLGLALREAIRLKHHFIGTEHLLLGILRDAGGTGSTILTEVGLNLVDLRTATEARLRDAA